MENIGERCPLCGTELSKVKYAEIQGKIRDQERALKLEEQQRLATAEKAMRLRLERQFQKQLQEQQEAAQKSAKEAVEAEIKKTATERDLATKKLKEAEAREVQIRKQVLELAEKQRQKELTQQREALEKDKAMALLKQEAAFHREREANQRRVAVLQQQLQRKTANELGDGAEIDIGEALRAAFRNDRITPVRKGEEGADFLHEVLHKGQVCGRTIIESKNHRGWKNIFIAKLRHDQVEAGAEHAILATTVFPAGKKELCIESGVIVVSPARAINS